MDGPPRQNPAYRPSSYVNEIMSRRWIWRALLIGYAAAIFTVSSFPLTNGGPLLPVPYGDKILHFAEFFLFGLIAAAGSLGRRPVLTALLLTGFYAGTDEFHQIFVPARDASIADWGADFVGAIFAALILVLLQRTALSSMRHRFILNRRNSDKGG